MLANSVLWTGAVVAISAAGGGMVEFAIAFVAISVLVQGALGDPGAACRAGALARGA